MPANTPLIEPNRCNCAALRKASRRIAQIYDSALAPSGLKATQFSVLAEIDRRSDTPATMRELASALVMDRSTLGQNLRPLERDGLITIETSLDDRRRRHILLTKTGRSRLRRAVSLWSLAQTVFEARFGASAAAELRGILLGIAGDRLPVAAHATPPAMPAA